MQARFDSALALRLALVVVLVGLLGLSARAHALTQALHGARQAIESEEPLRAAQYLAEAARQSPTQAELWEQAGSYAFQAGDYKAAITYLEERRRAGQEAAPLSQDGLSLEGYTLLGEAYSQLGDLDGAIRSWQAAVDRFGPSQEVTERLVDAHLLLMDYPGAIASLQAFVERNPGEARAHYRLGLLLATQEPEKALEHLSVAAALDPDLKGPAEELRRAIASGSGVNSAGIGDPGYSNDGGVDPGYKLVATGRALASLDEWGLATEAFRQATLRRPEYAEAWAYFGEALQHHGEGTFACTPPSSGPQAGLREIQKALELHPQSLSARAFLAMFWERQGRFDLALPAIQAAMELDPKNPTLTVQLASLQAASGKLAEAYKTYLLATDLSPHDPAYWRYMIRFSLQYDYQIDEIALPVARRLAAEYPEEAENLDLMAQVLMRGGDLDNAKRFLERTLQADPTYAPAHLHLGLAYALHEDLSAAYREFQRVLELAPSGPVADQAKRYLETYFP
jgi:tetratricopeptide (TPR) repeat protein